MPRPFPVKSKLKGSSVARRKRNFIRGRLRWKLIGSLCAGVSLGPPQLAVLFS